MQDQPKPQLSGAPGAGRIVVMPVGDPLSDRELQTVRLVVEGESNAEIAAALGVSARTVQAHIASAMRKTGTRTRTQLSVRALRTGIVPLNPEKSDD
jgi:DNA-binding CsgD family transcriptional regulator